LISFDIGHLNYHCASAFKLAARRTIAIRQEQLDRANLLVNVDVDVLACAGADPAELLD
jgi:hypothetical protein